jgi:hypothetical protein
MNCAGAASKGRFGEALQGFMKKKKYEQKNP